MNDLTTDELYLAAFAKPDDFKGDKLERLVFQRHLELGRRIREKIGSDTSTIAKLVVLLLEDSWSGRFPSHENAKSYEAKITARADLLEKIDQLLKTEAGSE